MEKLIENLKSYKEAAPKNSWKAIDQRLEQKRHHSVISIYRKLSIAAIFIALIACAGVMSIYVKSYNPDKFTVSTVYQPVIMEQLESNQDDLFDLNKVRNLHRDIQSLSAASSKMRNF